MKRFIVRYIVCVYLCGDDGVVLLSVYSIHTMPMHSNELQQHNSGVLIE